MLTSLPRLPLTALASTLLLHACSQASPDSSADSSLNSTPAPPTKRTTGTQADSLNGMQGHTFGEPLRNFPGLVLLSKDDELGVRWYQMPAGQERGWFGKHAEYSILFYQFQDGRFAMFEAVTTGIRMREEALSLFGPGKDRHDLMGGIGLGRRTGTGDVLRKTGTSGDVLAASVQQAAAAGTAGKTARAISGG